MMKKDRGTSFPILAILIAIGITIRGMEGSLVPRGAYCWEPSNASISGMPSAAIFTVLKRQVFSLSYFYEPGAMSFPSDSRLAANGYSSKNACYQWVTVSESAEGSNVYKLLPPDHGGCEGTCCDYQQNKVSFLSADLNPVERWLDLNAKMGSKDEVLLAHSKVCPQGSISPHDYIQYCAIGNSSLFGRDGAQQYSAKLRIMGNGYNLTLADESSNTVTVNGQYWVWNFNSSDSVQVPFNVFFEKTENSRVADTGLKRDDALMLQALQYSSKSDIFFVEMDSGLKKARNHPDSNLHLEMKRC